MPVEIIELPPADPAPAPAPAPAAAAAPPPPQHTAQMPRPKPVVRLYLATPCFGCQMTLAFLTSVLQLQAACAQRGYECYVDFIGNESLVERARNVLAARALASDATHLLFIDSDIAFQPDAVFRLVDCDKDVATAVYSKKAIDWDQVRTKLEAGEAREPVHQMGLDFNINIANPKESVNASGFVRVLDSATGFMLIKRAVLERMCAHYRDELFCVNDIPGQTTKDYVAIFACMVDDKTRRFLSEDYSFCRRWQQLGGEIWVDIASPLAHIGTNIFSGDIRQRMAPPKRLAMPTPAHTPAAVRPAAVDNLDALD